MPITSLNGTSVNGINGGSQAKSNGLGLKTEDFIKMMITQLQNQDPLEPAKNGELLQQMSQIGSLQASESTQSSIKNLTTGFQDALKGISLQTQLGSAASLIGKNVQGFDPDQKLVKGNVTSIRVVDNVVNLELDSGKALPLARVSQIMS